MESNLYHESKPTDLYKKEEVAVAGSGYII